MARAQARLLIGRTTKRDSISCRTDSRLRPTWMRPLLARVVNSRRVISQMAMPSAFFREASIAALALLDNLSGSDVSQRTTYVSSKINRDHPTPLVSRRGKLYLL